MAICNRCLSTLPSPDAPCPSCQSVGFASPDDSVGNGSNDTSNVGQNPPVRQTIVQPLANVPNAARRSPSGSTDLPELTGTSPAIRRTVSESAPVRPKPIQTYDLTGDQVEDAGPFSQTNAAAVSVSGAAKTNSSPSAIAPPQVYRPYRRPPTPVLIAIDEGSLLDGEILRIRGESFLIGRTEGDFRIPNDPDISGKHIELTVENRSGERVWTLRDLGSTNGTFVRINHATLVADKELLLGFGRYRVEIETAGSETGAADPSATNQQQDIRSTRVYAPSAVPAVVDESLRLVDVADAEKVFQFSDRGNILGRDPSLGKLRIDDPALNAKHARIAKVKNRWRIEDLGTTNGCWLRASKLRITQDMEFQIGEQRFRFLPNGYRGLAPLQPKKS